MEITIKTLDQARETRVTVEVNGARLYTATEVGNAQASEAELVAAPLRARIAELSRQLSQAWSSREDERQRADRLERELSDARQSIAARDRLLATATEEASLGRRQAITLGDELISERERNAEMKRELDRVNKGHVCVETCRPNAHVAFKGRRELDAMTRELADARRAIDILSGQLGRVSGAVHSDEVWRALRTTWERADARAMAEAIHAVRDALGSPSLPSPPGQATSQA
jgi:hypothetical protein